ncbi:MAG: SAM-dependent methyltransferase, partial [Povalibacter sp.]
ELTEILAPFEGETPRYHSLQWRSGFPAPGFSALSESEFSHVHEGAPERVIVDRTLSISFVAALPSEQRTQIAQRIRELIERTPELAARKTVRFPYRTVAFSCRKLV